ncbi:MAG TPA: RidA family protein, partial [Mycobacterium sp.]|nr:RidA family protein [Mycobacterium sp.]
RITRINPEQLHTPPGYHHITVVESGRTAFLAGQCPLDVSGTLVGAGDIDVQIDQVVSNSAIALAAVGAQPGQVVRSVVYVVSDDTAVLAAAWRRLTRSVIAPAFTTASTLLGVAQLGFPGQLIEIDLTQRYSDKPADNPRPLCSTTPNVRYCRDERVSPNLPSRIVPRSFLALGTKPTGAHVSAAPRRPACRDRQGRCGSGAWSPRVSAGGRSG